MSKKRYMPALCASLCAVVLAGCTLPGSGGKVELSTDKTYPAIGPYSQIRYFLQFIAMRSVKALRQTVC